MFAVLAVVVSGLGYGVASAAASLGAAPASTAVQPTSTPTPTPRVTPQPAPAEPTRDVLPEPETDRPVPAILEAGDRGPRVRDLQARLRQLEWYFGDVTDDYDAKTVEAVKGFQGKRGIPQTGYVDRVTLAKLHAMSHAPTSAELQNKPTDGTWTDAPLDPRCLTGRALCVDKSSRTLRWTVDGKVQRTFAVRFGSQYTPTREGAFRVDSKSRDHVSSIYDTPMPYAMFFSRGQAVHFSPDFAAVGYNGASHGCVNVRDRDGIAWLFDQVRVGDKVIVYWS